MPADSVPSGKPRTDSNSSASMDANSSENILGTSPGAASLRERTESESSDNSAMRYVLPSMDGSPPKVITINEVADVVKNIEKMELVHEMVLNPEFRLQRYEPPEDSLERRVKDILHRAFWDVLRSQLQETPPSYDHAIQLLTEIKDCLGKVLTPQNQRALERINEVLDETVIRQQAEQGVLDFKAYANFVIQIMAKSCAPLRDDDIEKLTTIVDVVDTFKGIMEILKLMQLDMVNCMLDSARNDIMVHSVEFEKEKFKKYLEYYKFGFPATETWLKRNRTQNSANNTPIPVDQSIWNAYLELMDWEEANEFPEVFSMDKQRILKLGQRAKRLCVCASLNAIVSGIPIISQRTENRVILAKEIEILLQDVTNEREISEVIQNIWVQIKSKVNEFLTKENQGIMDSVAENTLNTQILQIANKDSPVRSLMWKRLQTYFRLMSRSKLGLPPPPPGYVEYKEELESYTTALKLVISYNHSVFGEYFKEVLNKEDETGAIPSSTSPPTTTTQLNATKVGSESQNSEPN